MLFLALLPSLAAAAATFSGTTLAIGSLRHDGGYFAVTLELGAGILTLTSSAGIEYPGYEDAFFDAATNRIKVYAVEIGGSSTEQAELELAGSEPFRFRLAWRSVVSLDTVAPGLVMADLPGGEFVMGETEAEYSGPPFTFDAPEHSVTLAPFKMSAAAITNEQYAWFLNHAEAAGFVEVSVGTNPGPDLGKMLVVGTSAADPEYAGQSLIVLDGTRVMKDHDDGDGDGNEFTGSIEPENPLNICWIGYTAEAEVGSRFFVEDPADFDWVSMTDYCDYHPTLQGLSDPTSCHNDYDAWPELLDLPPIADVRQWPATFVRWTGARAYALQYGLDLPTEAQWEYAAQGGAAFEYATADGAVAQDGTSANWNYAHEVPALHYVIDVHGLAPNPFGLWQMAGNVWEWCADYYGSAFYTDGAVDPVNTDPSSNKRVRRGGSWNYHLATLKAASRFSDEEYKGNDHFGFRVVRN